MTGSNSWQSLEGHMVKNIDLEVVPATLTRMDVFDKVCDFLCGTCA